MNRTLNISTDTFDTVNTFKVEINNGRRVFTRTAYIFDCETDGVTYVMLRASTLQSSYSAEQTAERDRLLRETPVRNGDVVIFNGEERRVRILGEYSDAGRLDRM